MSNCPICRRSMLKFNLKKYGMCFTCYMKNKMSENNCGGTAKGSGNSELGNNSEESHITTSSQESSPQETDLVRWYHIEMHLDKEQIEELKKHLRKKYGHFLIKLSEMKNDNSF